MYLQFLTSFFIDQTESPASAPLSWQTASAAQRSPSDGYRWCDSLRPPTTDTISRPVEMSAIANQTLTFVDHYAFRFCENKCLLIQ